MLPSLPSKKRKKAFSRLLPGVGPTAMQRQGEPRQPPGQEVTSQQRGLVLGQGASHQPPGPGAPHSIFSTPPDADKQQGWPRKGDFSARS